MDQCRDDLSWIGQEAKDVTDCPKHLRIMIIIQYSAMPAIAMAEGVGAVEVVKHREVRPWVWDVQACGARVCFGPIVSSGDPIAFPQDVARVEVAVYQPMPGWWRPFVEDGDRPSPQFRPRGPARPLKIIWSPDT